jgi:hypothetical protein
MSSEDMAADPQYQAREMHIEWEDGQADKVKGVGIVPKYSRTPGKIWRGAVGLGFDNPGVYSELLGISAEELKELSQQDALRLLIRQQGRAPGARLDYALLSLLLRLWLSFPQAPIPASLSA